MEYNDLGHGTPIVLIHGFCESRLVWKYCEPELSKSCRVISVDLPGFGESRWEETPVSMDYYASCINDLLLSLNIEKCILVGHSLGGYVALAFAELYPNKVIGFGLFHSTAFADTDEKKENRNKTIAFIQKHGVPLFAESFVAPLFSLRNRELFKTEINELIHTASACSEEAVLAATVAMRDRPDRTHVLRKTKSPVLFVVGKLDVAVPLEKSLEQCYLPPRSVVHFIEEIGHMGMIENKKEAIRILSHFVRFCIE